MFATLGRSRTRRATTGSRGRESLSTGRIGVDTKDHDGHDCENCDGPLRPSIRRLCGIIVPPRPASDYIASPPAAASLAIHSDASVPAPADHPAPVTPVAQRPATVVKPLDMKQSPPPLAAKYPETDRPANSRPGDLIGPMLPAKEVRTHKIVDGDTLAALAQLYLGSAARAREIFDANRAVLSDPQLLPIGAELKIPPTDGRQSPR